MTPNEARVARDSLEKLRYKVEPVEDPKVSFSYSLRAHDQWDSATLFFRTFEEVKRFLAEKHSSNQEIIKLLKQLIYKN